MSLLIDVIEQPFLFEPVVPCYVCQRCFDTGVWRTPKGEVAVCPRVQMRQPHAEPNNASLILRRATNRLFQNQLWVNPMAFDLARILTHYNASQPCRRESLGEFFFADTNLTANIKLRKFHLLVEELRKIWLLPVGSRKEEPSGYWIITNLADFKEWINRVKSAPITQLATIHRVARHNFPVFAEQLEMEFWNDLKTEAND